MKITACCCTYCRPETLAEMLWCFERQDYADRELMILDDAGQYHNQEGDRWRLVSSRARYPTLGEKRNASIRLSSDAEFIAIWDDDDLYLPWALSAVADALSRSDFCRPSLVLQPTADNLALEVTPGDGFYHGSWGFRRSAWESADGYPAMDNGEDKVLAERLQGFARECNPIALGYKPYYVYRNSVSGWSISGHGPDGYDVLGRLHREPAVLSPRPPKLAMTTVLEGIQPRRW
jgi:glycosyltransferase involved in cell wall biosynthesis